MSNIESFTEIEEPIILDEAFIDPEELDQETLIALLKEGQITNIHPIEDICQEIAPHADKVLVGNLKPHQDMIFEAEISLPDQNRKLLVVYKPESGINHGTKKKKMNELPKESSSYANKEVAAWIVAKEAGLSHISTPAIIRNDLVDGRGSLRSFISGKPLEKTSDYEYATYLQEGLIEDVAFYDYIIQNIDGSTENIIAKDSSGLTSIDHTLTFFDEDFALDHLKGPRLIMAFDNSTDPPTLKNNPLPERFYSKIEQFITRREEITLKLSELLTEQEINGIFDRLDNLQSQQIFL